MIKYGKNGNRDIAAKGEILFETDTLNKIEFKPGIIYHLTQTAEYDYDVYPAGYYIYVHTGNDRYLLQRLDKPVIHLNEFQEVGVEFSIPKEKVDIIQSCFDALLILEYGDIEPSVFRLQANTAGILILYTADSVNGLKYQLKITVDWRTGQAKGTVTEVENGGGTENDYISLERMDNYLYQVTFDDIPAHDPSITSYAGGCSSFVRDGKLYRNLDFTYDNTAEFVVKCKDFVSTAFINGLNDGNLDIKKVGQLPYHINDGVNKDGIMVSSHILYNDWSYSGAGNKDKDITLLPYYILTNLHSMANINSVLSDYLSNIKIPDYLINKGYLLQYIVTDGTTTYAVIPPTSGGAYILQDITDNPKLTNFRWVSDKIVNRHNLQTRPNGVERWNAITEDTQLADLRFTKAYESADRLSEFIGINDTTKDSTDEELEEIYNTAHARYLTRTRNGETWQTCHSVIYNKNGIESLFAQEDYGKDYFAGNGGGSGECAWGSIKGNIDSQADLKDRLDAINARFAGKLNLYQGKSKVGYPLVVNSNGNVVPQDMFVKKFQGTAHTGKPLIVDNDGNVRPTVNSLYIQRNTHYNVGDRVYSEKLKPGEFLVCTVAGTTGETEPTWGAYDTETTDGTAKFLRIKFARNDKLSMPSGIIIDTGFTASLTKNNNSVINYNYYAPSDGYINVSATKGTNTSDSAITVSDNTGTGVGLGNIQTMQATYKTRVTLAVKKGVKVTYGYRNLSDGYCNFIPADSAE